MSNNKKNIYFRSGSGLFNVVVIDPKKNYPAKKLIDICPDDTKIMDMDIDFRNSIVYAITENGAILGKSFFMKPYMSTVWFSTADDKS